MLFTCDSNHSDPIGMLLYLFPSCLGKLRWLNDGGVWHVELVAIGQLFELCGFIVRSPLVIKGSSCMYGKVPEPRLCIVLS